MEITNMKSILSLILTVSVYFLMIAQSKFTIEGKSTIYNNKSIRFLPILINADSLSCKIKLKENKITIKNNQFLLKGNISDYPQPLEVEYFEEDKNTTYYSLVFIDNRQTNYTVTIPYLSKNKNMRIDVINGQSQKEYNLILKQLDNEKIELMSFKKDNFNKKNDFLQKYIKKNPDSFVALWMTLSDYRYIGYDKAFQTNLNLFGKKVKKSDVYKAFILSIKKDLKLSEGNIFPKMNFDNKSLDSAFGEKYTLVDFWFSSCISCLEQIPSYKLTYEKYKNKGFEFIGVSTDRTQNIYNWGEVIKKNNLIWINFLDENGVQSKIFNIERFPTNYLLDSEGKIINYNISPKELGEFLEQNLH